MTDIELSSSTYKEQENFSVGFTKLKIDSEERKINIQYLKFLNIPYFHFGHTISFYYPNTEINQDFKYPPFCLGPGHNQFLIMIIVGIISYVILYFLLFYISNIYYKILFPIFLFIAIIDSIILLVKNPGFIYKQNEHNQNSLFYCHLCGFWVEKGLYTHCSSCNCCCANVDHHCGVVGTCISKKNILFFRILIVIVSFMNGFSFFIIFLFFVSGFSK